MKSRIFFQKVFLTILLSFAFKGEALNAEQFFNFDTEEFLYRPDYASQSIIEPEQINLKLLDKSLSLELSQKLPVRDYFIAEDLLERLTGEFNKSEYEIKVDSELLDFENTVNSEKYRQIWERNLIKKVHTEKMLKPGALSGKKIFLSPGHGYYYDSGRWLTQRFDTYGYGLIEDFHTNEIVFDHLKQMLENAGAEVITGREIDYQNDEFVYDTDSANFFASSGFTKSPSTGFTGTNYMVKEAATNGADFAKWTFTAPENGFYPLYISTRPGSNRITNTNISIRLPGKNYQKTLDQKNTYLGWYPLGKYYLSRNEELEIVIDNKSTENGYVIADAIRIGGKAISINRDNAAYPHQGWQLSARYYAELIGAPEDVIRNDLSERTRDITVRPVMAEWYGADLYFSLHTNAISSASHKQGLRGYGTSSFIYKNGATAGSDLYQKTLHNRLISEIRANYKNDWSDRGLKSANFGELRLLKTMPGLLLELAFHDTEDPDGKALHSPVFRDIAARGILKGMIDYLNPSLKKYPPLPPKLKRIYQAENDSEICIEFFLDEDNSDKQKASSDSIDLYLGKHSPFHGEKIKTFKAKTGNNDFCFTNSISGSTNFLWLKANNVAGSSIDSNSLAYRINQGQKPKTLLLVGYERYDKSTPKRYHKNIYWKNIAKKIPTSFLSSILSSAGSYPLDSNIFKRQLFLAGNDNNSASVLSEDYLKNLSIYLSNGGFALWSGNNIAYSFRNKPTFLRQVFQADYQIDNDPSDAFKGIDQSIFDSSDQFKVWKTTDEILAPAKDIDSYASDYLCMKNENTNFGPCSYTANSILIGFPLSSLKNGMEAKVLANFFKLSGADNDSVETIWNGDNRDISDNSLYKPSDSINDIKKKNVEEYQGEEGGCLCNVNESKPKINSNFIMIVIVGFMLLLLKRKKRNLYSEKAK